MAKKNETREGEKELGLMATVDTLNRRWGKGTLAFAASGFTRPWWIRQAKKSPLFTTSWADLPAMKA